MIDEKCIKLVSDLIPTSQLQELNILGIEKLQLKRKSFPNLAAIYLCENTQKSLELVANDFPSANN